MNDGEVQSLILNKKLTEAHYEKKNWFQSSLLLH